MNLLDKDGLQHLIDTIKGFFEGISTEMANVKKSVSDGKKSVADAITAKGQTTAADATFATMATNIGNIQTGITPSGTLTLSDVTSGTDCTTYATVATSGLMKTPTATLTLTDVATNKDCLNYAKVTTSGLVKPTTTKAGGTYNLGTSDQTISAGTYFSANATIKGATSGTLTLSDVTSGTNCTTYSSVKTSGLMKTPTATLTKSYTTNGTETVDCTNYAKVTITRNCGLQIVEEKIEGVRFDLAGNETKTYTRTFSTNIVGFRDYSQTDQGSLTPTISYSGKTISIKFVNGSSKGKNNAITISVIREA